MDLLGFRVIRENFRPEKNDYKLDLAVGDLELELFSAPNAPARVTGPEALGLRHLAFRVENVAETVQALRSVQPRSLALVVGPEGDFSARERAVARNAGARPVSLGARTLRSETAALYALSVLTYEFGL